MLCEFNDQMDFDTRLFVPFKQNIQLLLCSLQIVDISIIQGY